MPERDILMHVRREDSGTPANDYDVLYPKTLDRLVMDEKGVSVRDKLNTKLDAALYTAILFMLPLGVYPHSLVTLPVYNGAGVGYGVMDFYSGRGGPGGNAIYYGEGLSVIIFDASFLAYR